MKISHIRNFCIIAHIDHGKSTFADRLLEITGALQQREMQAQFLDNMDIERERGITIKAQTVCLNYKAKDGQEYQLNLIDTPGHIDFHYEVSRAIAACEGAILIVDASQGIEAQTLANTYIALEHNLEIIPVLNKIDLPAADPERVLNELQEIIGFDKEDALLISAKTGKGIDAVLERIVELIPPPQKKDDDEFKALIFDSWFDSYLGVIILFRVFSGKVSQNDTVLLMKTNKRYAVQFLGKFSPAKTKKEFLESGEVGFLAASIKTIQDVKIGDTITLSKQPAKTPLKGYKQIQPMVFCGIFPVDTAAFGDLNYALDKLLLNDSSIQYEPETSQALGFGFRCGFLGLLHMEISRERLEREFNLNLLITAPTVVYKIITKKEGTIFIENPSQLPALNFIEHIEEPYILATIYLPEQYLGVVMQLCIEKRGTQEALEYIGSQRICLKFYMPLAEIVVDFFDKLKSMTKGYASFDYELQGYQTAKLVRLDILLNTEPVDALSLIVHVDKAYHRGRALTKKLKEIIQRQMFEVAIQAAIGNKIIARETISAMRKNVTAKCYGGDISRKRKLLEKQKEGKKRLKRFGNVEIPHEAFTSLLKIDS